MFDMQKPEKIEGFTGFIFQQQKANRLLA